MNPKTKLGKLLMALELWASVALVVGTLVEGSQGVLAAAGVLAFGALVKALVVANEDGKVTADELVDAIRKALDVFEEERTPRTGSRVTVKRDE